MLSTSKNPDLGPAISHIERLISENCSHPDLALFLLSQRVNLSTRHLGRLFRKRTGGTFRQYLREVRLKRAAELLASGQDIKSVAALVGYSSRTHFDSDFRRRFGCTPAEHKKVSALIQPLPCAL
jgi:two-component system response regulator YesN